MPSRNHPSYARVAPPPFAAGRLLHCRAERSEGSHDNKTLSDAKERRRLPAMDPSPTALARPASLTTATTLLHLPAVIEQAGEGAATNRRVLHRRDQKPSHPQSLRPGGRFLAWCEARGFELEQLAAGCSAGAS